MRKSSKSKEKKMNLFNSTSSGKRALSKKHLIILFFLAIFSSLFLFAEYFHTETTLNPLDNCPICQWERSIYTPGQLAFVCILIAFILLYRLGLEKDIQKSIPIDLSINSRAPPLL